MAEHFAQQQTDVEVVPGKEISRADETLLRKSAARLGAATPL
jgi:hypothetical protein